jgi:hypothetical protein
LGSLNDFASDNVFGRHNLVHRAAISGDDPHHSRRLGGSTSAQRLTKLLESHGVQVGRLLAHHGVDFCFECADFPCDKADFEPMLKPKWLKANERMEAIGPEAYLEEAKSKSHYA